MTMLTRANRRLTLEVSSGERIWLEEQARPRALFVFTIPTAGTAVAASTGPEPGRTSPGLTGPGPHGLLTPA